MWFMPWIVVKYRHFKDTYSDEIGLCTRNIDMIMNSIVDAIKSANIKRNIIFKLPSYNFCISSTPITRLKWQFPQFPNLKWTIQLRANANVKVLFGVRSARNRAACHTSQVCRFWKDTKKRNKNRINLAWEGVVYTCMK